jgi:linoleoyl-CoA desaturase
VVTVSTEDELLAPTATLAAPPRPKAAPSGASQGVRYPAHSPMWKELNRRVDAYFSERGSSKNGDGRLWSKTVVILSVLVASWALLVFAATTWWQALPLMILLSLSMVGVGFNIQHDGGHDAYATTTGWNRFVAFGLDLVGGSSYVWRFKHSVIHHHFTNIDGVDDDINARPFLRLSPDQSRYRFHRFQHWYAWPLFGFLPPKWTFIDDFKALIRGRIGSQRMPRPKGASLAFFVLGKLGFISWIFVIPMLAGHSFGLVLGYYAIYCLVGGIVMSTVFQMAHVVQEADFVPAPPEGERMDRCWSEHQLATTVDFAPGNRFLTWFLGGLNYQVEHHLFPRISHIHYPALANIVRETCAEFGVLHRSHPTFWSAIVSHVRHLRQLGEPVPA